MQHGMTHIDRTCHHTTKQITCRPAHLLIPQSHSEFLELMNNVKKRCTMLRFWTLGVFRVFRVAAVACYSKYRTTATCTDLKLKSDRPATRSKRSTHGLRMPRPAQTTRSGCQGILNMHFTKQGR
jgi:hypothetical protein